MSTQIGVTFLIIGVIMLGLGFAVVAGKFCGKGCNVCDQVCN